MKARVKATEDVVEVSLSHIVYDGGKKIIWYNTSQGASFTEDELEFFDTEENFDYWTRLEHQYAGMVMQGMLARTYHQGLPLNRVVEDAQYVAYALVEKLKEKEEK